MSDRWQRHGTASAHMRQVGPVRAREHKPSTAAKLRSDLSRLSRKTWVTTKKLERLQAHVDLYAAWHNGYTLRA